VQQHTDNKLIYLVPELCRMAGLSAKQRKDKRLMDQIAIHTRLDPNERYNRIQNLAEQLFKGEQNMV
jgi:aubergine-like protein